MMHQGTVLNNRFQIEELVGSGGMSLIYKGNDLLKNRTVAIKMLREQFTSDPMFIMRFRREGQAVAGLSHPNIVKIYSVCQDEDVYYLVLELIDGSDLKQILQNRARPFEPTYFSAQSILRASTEDFLFARSILSTLFA